MQVITCDLPRSLTSIELHPFADDHIGDPFCNEKLIKTRIEHVKNTPNAFIGLGGDIVNNAITSSVSDTYTEKLSPMQQINRAVELYYPVKDRILYAVMGNHCYRSYKSDGIDLMAIIAKELGIYERYSDTAAFIFLRLGTLSREQSRNRRVVYRIYATHGSGGGKRIGGKANRVEDLKGIVDADIYIHAHTHQPLVFTESTYRAHNNTSSVELVTQTFVNTAGALDYGGYASRAGYQPANSTNPIIMLSGTGKNVRVII